MAGLVQDLDAALRELDGGDTVGGFLLQDPVHAPAVSRVQLAARMPFSEIHANLLDREFHPADGINYFLSVVLGIELPVAASNQ